jgi:hypothetical protein
VAEISKFLSEKSKVNSNKNLLWKIQVQVGTFWCLNVKFKTTYKLKLFYVLFGILKYTFFRQIVKQNDSLGKYLPLKVFTCFISVKIAVKSYDIRSAIFGPICAPPPSRKPLVPLSPHCAAWGERGGVPSVLSASPCFPEN